MALTLENQLALPTLEPKARLKLAQIATRRKTVVARNAATMRPGGAVQQPPHAALMRRNISPGRIWGEAGVGVKTGG